MDWKRTGPITLKSGDYLIIRLIMDPQYLAMHGPQLARTDLGRHSTAENAKACCESHSEAIGEKNPQAA